MANESIWSPRNTAHQALFSRLLKPAVRASATTLFDDDRIALEVLQAWIMQLHDVPEDVLFAGFAEVFGQGITWMPKPGDVRKACAALIDERRRAAGVRGRALMAGCETCGGSGWQTVTDDAGVSRAKRCDCHRMALELQKDLPAALALPPAPDEVLA